MRTRALQSLLIFTATSGLLWSQANPPAAPAAATPPPATPAAVIQGAEPSGSGASRTKDTLSVDFPDEDIRTILRNVADLFELNLVIPDTLQGKTSIKLRDVTWKQIFEVILTPVGYTYIEQGSIIKVVSTESLAQEPVITEVFILNYARAAEIQPIVAALVESGAGGKLVTDNRSNALVITERPSKMKRIRPIIEQLDRATDQVMIESKFVEVTNRDVKNIGVNWASLQNYSLSATGLTHTYSKTRGQTGSNGYSNNTSTTNGTTASTTTTATNGTNTSVQTGEQTMVYTDIYGNVSYVQVPQNTNTTGTSSETSTTATSGTSGSTSSTYSLLSSLTNTVDQSAVTSAVFSASDFSLILSALQTQNDTKVVSNPTVVTLNNTEATINVGEEDPIPNYTYNQERGSFEVSGFVYKPIGILLKVTPQVNARGFIKLTLAPEVSQKNGSTTFGGSSGASIPIIATRKATTQVTLKDGYTMGIGGLLSVSGTKGQTKVPVLGSIPVLGRLFRSDTKDETTTNLLIFVTAKTISAEGAPVEQIFNSSQVRQMGLRRDELPGYRDGSDPFVQPEQAKKK